VITESKGKECEQWAAGPVLVLLTMVWVGAVYVCWPGSGLLLECRNGGKFIRMKDVFRRGSSLKVYTSAAVSKKCNFVKIR